MQGRVKKTVRGVIYPEGEYAFTIEDTEDRHTKAGDPKIRCSLEINEGPEGTVGKKLEHDVIIWPAGHKMEWVYQSFLKAIGAEYDEETDEYVINTNLWPGQSFRATLKHGEFRGETLNELRNYKPL